MKARPSLHQLCRLINPVIIGGVDFTELLEVHLEFVEALTDVTFLDAIDPLMPHLIVLLFSAYLQGTTAGSCKVSLDGVSMYREA